VKKQALPAPQGDGDIHKYINNSTRDEKANGGILLYFDWRTDRINLQKRGEKPLPAHG